jgi:hypothetical protein
MGICHLRHMRRKILYLPVDSIESTSRMSRTQQFKRHRGVLPPSPVMTVSCCHCLLTLRTEGMNLGGTASSTRSLPSLKQTRCPFLFMHIMCDSSPLRSQMQHKNPSAWPYFPSFDINHLRNLFPCLRTLAFLVSVPGGALTTWEY